jgi:hypothetical protein
MKRSITTLISALGLWLATGCVYAQEINVTANVPFNFMVQNATLPAGSYSIASISSSASKALVVRNRDSGKSLLLIPNSAESLNGSDKTKLVFHRYGAQYFLSQIWVEGERTGREVLMGRREAETAINRSPDQDVIVLASLR